MVCAQLERRVSGGGAAAGGTQGLLRSAVELPAGRRPMRPGDLLAATALGHSDLTHPSHLSETSLLEISFRRRWFAFLQTPSFGE